MRKNWLFAITGFVIFMIVLALPGCASNRSAEANGLEGLSVTPSPGENLSNSDNKSTEIVLKYVQADKVLSDKQYFSPWYPLRTVKEGEYILEVNGSIQNNNSDPEITMYAKGYDKVGNQVAWTLDQSSISGQIGLHLQKGGTGEFALHLNYSEDIKSIRIFADNYQTTPP
jgi:hypothetical protein